MMGCLVYVNVVACLVIVSATSDSLKIHTTYTNKLVKSFGTSELLSADRFQKLCESVGLNFDRSKRDIGNDDWNETAADDDILAQKV